MRLSEAKRILKEAGIEDHSFDARAIFSEIGGVRPADMIGNDPDLCSEEVLLAVKRRAAREPLQYILGYTYFYRERYTVNEDCLIPRRDTEVLVECAIRNLPRGESFIDLCTGSGCVGISVLSNTEGTRAVLADISEKALSVAERNAGDNGVADRAQLVLCDLRTDFPDGEWYAILSNPPYVSDGAYETLEREISYEPKIAFVGGEDGADFYRRLVPECLSHLKDGGFIAFEIGYDQAEIILEIAQDHGLCCEIINDLSGNPRVAFMKKR